MANNPCVSSTSSFIYTPPIFPLGTRKPYYSNNSMIFYKRATVYSSTSGTVRNSRAISRRT